MTEKTRLANLADTSRCFWKRNEYRKGWRIMSVSGDGQTVFCIPVTRSMNGKIIRRVPAGEAVTFPAGSIDWSTMSWPRHESAETQEAPE